MRLVGEPDREGNEAMRIRVICESLLLPLIVAVAHAADGVDGAAKPKDLLFLVRSHMDRQLAVGIDSYGPEATPLWLAGIDPVRGGLPERRDPLGQRWYRDIHSPAGSNLYWDQPLIVTAYALSNITGLPHYAQAADAYVRVFLERCVAEPTGLFLWGNHIYYDVQTDEIVRFSGGYHELRPHPVAWSIFYRLAPDKTRRAILSMYEQHVKDKDLGLFCRHADPFASSPPEPNADSKPFLEAGAVLIESLAFLGHREPERLPEIRPWALQIAEYSYAHRDPATGLVRNQPVSRRWDYFASSTEIGLWAGSLLRAARLLDEPRLATLADSALSDWLRYGWDDDVALYYGQLEISTGQPLDPGDHPRHQPRRHSLVWQTDMAPTHDYPMPAAEACLSLLRSTGKESYRTAVHRWVRHVQRSLPPGDGRGGCAEEYGRVIHFLARAATELEDPSLAELAHRVAEDAADKLFLPSAGMFRSHPGEERTDAIDGPGVLLLALLYLHTGREPDLAGFAF
jgi:hypothetical protein